jgi:hypothetical protein
VPRFTVILSVVLHGATVGSTEDVIEATDAAEAEVKAIAAWRAVRPDRSFRPLLTVEQT